MCFTVVNARNISNSSLAESAAFNASDRSKPEQPGDPLGI